jgi:hypothetical protein
MDLLALITSGLPVIQALGLVSTTRLPIRTTILRHGITLQIRKKKQRKLLDNKSCQG